MNLSAGDVEWLCYAVQHVIELRRRSGVPIPDRLRRLAERLFQELDLIADEQPVTPAPAEDQISAATAAQILGCSQQWVRRLAADLDGCQIGRTWVFSRRRVEEYAAAMGAA
ncbi:MULTISPECIES: helix-turn-helix domain-containing protein [Nocardia]|uniref:helix-turn-helix domain-containing protein n=1 Tax=Nocardia TaxID=1817 RepID=UPI002456251A|nr:MULTISPECIES: hypothetical protein [Nocardia]